MKRKESDEMTVFKVETYVIKPEKQEEYRTTMKKWAAYIKKNKEKCKELRSWKLFSQIISSNAGGYVEMSEFENLTDYEKFISKTFHGPEQFFKMIMSVFTTCIVPGTYSVSIWNSVM